MGLYHVRCVGRLWRRLSANLAGHRLAKSITPKTILGQVLLTNPMDQRKSNGRNGPLEAQAKDHTSFDSLGQKHNATVPDA